MTKKNVLKNKTKDEIIDDYLKALDEIEEELKAKNLEFKKLGGYLSYLKNIKDGMQKGKGFTKKESEYILIHAVYAIEEIYKIIEKIG